MSTGDAAGRESVDKHHMTALYIELERLEKEPFKKKSALFFQVSVKRNLF